MPSTTPATAAISALSLHDALPIFPRYARLSVAGGGATVKPPVRVAVCPFGFVTTTSRGPSVAVDPIVFASGSRVTDSCCVWSSDVSSSDLALAPAWKLVPATVAVGLVPGAPVLGVTLVIVGIRSEERRVGKECRSPRSAVREHNNPGENTVLGSVANA